MLKYGFIAYPSSFANCAGAAAVTSSTSLPLCERRDAGLLRRHRRADLQRPTAVHEGMVHD
jgi:hypothetical protein